MTFRPSPAKTPALRSGTIDPTAPYTFSLPKNKRWKEAKVANAISGNYCQYEPSLWILRLLPARD